ncbi:DNA gyrase subunit A [bacterium]|nr:DNA gyrase subunit A [bacterium]
MKLPFESAQQEIIPVDIEEEMKHSYLDYAMSTIVGRALPDVRDGLKPVQRRILYAMQEMGNTHNKPYKKSARIVGDTMGKYHPHGNDAIYDALVRMAQDFSLRYPLIDGQGNFGSIDGDSPAAMRYTEVRMKKLAEELLAEIQEETVDFVPNYDNSLQEPKCLPAKFPNLLVNGASGIAVGMATNIPPHNLGEIIDALQYLIENPQCTIAELMRFLPGPDFPTAGFIVGRSGIREAYETGRGKIQMRARLYIEQGQRGARDKIIITEIPYQLNKTLLIEQIVQLVQMEKLKEIADIRDESDREGMRIVIEVKRGEMPQIVANKLYKLTRLQMTYGIIFLALRDGRPVEMNLKEMLEAYLDHRKQVVIRRSRYRLRKAKEREHILVGLKTALDNIDLVVDIIRSSKDTPEARRRLMESLSLSEVQAQAILDMRLARLTSLEQSKIIAELDDIRRLIAYLEEVLASPRKILEIISDELAEIKKNYADERRTQILDDDGEIDIEDIIADEDMVISVTRGGYIKRMPISAYQSQRRGGRGKTAMTTKEEDFVEKLFVPSSHDTMLFLTRKGKAFALKVYQIPEAGRYSRGTAIVNLLQIEKGDFIASTVAVREFSDDKYIFFATKKGFVKRTQLSAFANVRKHGIIAIGIPEDDELIDCQITSGAEDVMLITRQGKSIRFPAKQVRSMGRTARGVHGIRLRNDDEVVAMVVIKNPEGTILFASENGFGKRTKAKEFRVQQRAGMGIIAMKVTERTGKVVGAIEVSEGDQVVLVNSDGVLIRIDASGISTIGRATQGVKLISLTAGQKLTGLARVIERENEKNENQESLLKE